MRGWRLRTLCWRGVALCLAVMLASTGTAQIEKIPVDEPPGAVELPPVQILVSKHVEVDRVVYWYRVVNGSAFPILRIQIGFDYPHLQPELRMFASDTVAAGVSSPPEWEFRIEPTEEDSVGSVVWETDTLATGILGGASQGGFALPLAEADTMYEMAHWTAYVVADDELYFTGTLEPDGTASVPLSSMHSPEGVRVVPNPAQGRVLFEFQVPAAGVVTVDVFDAAGRSMRQVMRRVVPAGKGSAIWDGRDLQGRQAGPGTYFVRVRTATSQRFARIAWLR